MNIELGLSLKAEVTCEQQKKISNLLPFEISLIVGDKIATTLHVDLHLYYILNL